MSIQISGECAKCGCIHQLDKLAEKDKEIERLRANEEKLMLQIERAFEIEREACAKVAENHYEFPNEGPEIANAIRNQP